MSWSSTGAHHFGGPRGPYDDYGPPVKRGRLAGLDTGSSTNPVPRIVRQFRVRLLVHRWLTRFRDRMEQRAMPGEEDETPEVTEQRVQVFLVLFRRLHNAAQRLWVAPGLDGR